MESRKVISSVSFFKMPLHYPRYTKKDYQDMPEWKLDRLLAEYGLSADGDLAHKREFAMGAFLWPDLRHNQNPSLCSYRNHAVKDASTSLGDKKLE